MSYSHSLVLIVPAALKDAANAMGQAIGWTGDNLTVALSASGNEPATHFGCHAWAQDIAVAWLTGTPIPESMGVDQSQVNGLLSQIVASVDADGLQGREHFDAVVLSNNLKELSSD